MWTDANTEQQLIAGVIRYGPSILEYCQTSSDISQYLNHIETEYLDYPYPKNNIDPANWFIPKQYQDEDIEQFCLNQCSTEEERERVQLELSLYKKHNMISVLKTMRYVVDILRSNNVVWGVGRGSSVASYVLHILKVHKVDSIKYNIPIEEFFKGDQNG